MGKTTQHAQPRPSRVPYLFPGRRRRQANRYSCPLASLGKVYVSDSGPVLQVWVKNLSRDGIGFNLSQPLPLESEVVIFLKAEHPKTYFNRPARVVHATQEIDGSWRVGCEFAKVLSAEDLEILL